MDPRASTRSATPTRRFSSETPSRSATSWEASNLDVPITMTGSDSKRLRTRMTGSTIHQNMKRHPGCILRSLPASLSTAFSFLISTSRTHAHAQTRKTSLFPFRTSPLPLPYPDSGQQLLAKQPHRHNLDIGTTGSQSSSVLGVK